MTAPKSEAHSRAVVHLQALLSKHRPGTLPHVIAERALDLAFNRMSARGVALEQQLLQEAAALIQQQVEARLIALPLGHAVLLAQVHVPTRAPKRAFFSAMPALSRRHARSRLPRAGVRTVSERV